MRIISFSNASIQPLLAAPARIVTPWMTRLKNSLGHVAALSGAQKGDNVSALQPLKTFEAREAPEAPALPCQTTSKASTRDSLRVVRESDTAIGADCAGRMVISGRMADVCAELDRMVLRATTTRH